MRSAILIVFISQLLSVSSSYAVGAKAASGPNATARFMSRELLQACDSCCDPAPACDSCCEAPVVQDCSSVESQLSSCSSSLSRCQREERSCDSDLSTCTRQLNEANAIVAGVGQVCSDMKDCRAQILNAAEIEKALNQSLNTTVSNTTVAAVKKYLESALDKGKCASADTTCGGRQYPTCPRGSVRVSEGSALKPKYAIYAAIVGAFYFAHQEMVDETLDDCMQWIQDGAAWLKSSLMGSSSHAVERINEQQEFQQLQVDARIDVR